MSWESQYSHLFTLPSSSCVGNAAGGVLSLPFQCPHLPWPFPGLSADPEVLLVPLSQPGAPCVGHLLETHPKNFIRSLLLTSLLCQPENLSVAVAFQKRINLKSLISDGNPNFRDFFGETLKCSTPSSFLSGQTNPGQKLL